MSKLEEKIADFHVRLGRIEQSVEESKQTKVDSTYENIVEFVTACVALAFCYLGFGLPNHYYQYLFGFLIILSLYHKNKFPFPKHWSEYVLAIINILLLSVLLKILVGGGEPKPLSWVAYPTIEGGITSFKLAWQPIELSNWELPLTVIQSFFLIVTLFGSLIGFTLLSGLSSFILTILAIPALVDFNWAYAMPGMIAALTTFYLQAD